MNTIVFDSSAILAYADCFAAALAQHTDGEIMTGDPAFEIVTDQVGVRWLPSH